MWLFNPVVKIRRVLAVLVWTYGIKTEVCRRIWHGNSDALENINLTPIQSGNTPFSVASCYCVECIEEKFGNISDWRKDERWAVFKKTEGDWRCIMVKAMKHIEVQNFMMSAVISGSIAWAGNIISVILKVLNFIR